MKSGRFPLRCRDLEAYLDLGLDHAFEGARDEGVHTLFEHLGNERVGRTDDEFAVAVGNTDGVLEPCLEVRPGHMQLKLA